MLHAALTERQKIIEEEEKVKLKKRKENYQKSIYYNRQQSAKSSSMGLSSMRQSVMSARNSVAESTQNFKSIFRKTSREAIVPAYHKFVSLLKICNVMLQPSVMMHCKSDKELVTL